MSPPKINPLTDEHRQCFDAILEAAPGIQDLIDRCKKCGIDVGDREQRFHAAVNTARLMRDNFFPRDS